MSPTILITGATGTIGSKVIRQFADQGVRVRAGVRTAAKAEQFKDLDVEIVELDYGKPETVKSALEGMEKMFLVIIDIPNHGAVGGQLAAAAKASGVRHLVKLSAMGADRDSYTLGNWHGDAEREIDATGIPRTYLRPNSFMQNFSTFFKPRDGNIYLPLGDGKVSYVDARDVAASAVAALQNDEFIGQAHELSGPESISIGDVAATIEKVTGKKTRYVDSPEPMIRKAMMDRELPEWFVDGVMEMHGVNKAGEYEPVTDGVKVMTGQEPRSFEQFVSDYADRF